MVGTLEEMKDDLATVTDYTKNGECSQCGKCCANLLPLSLGEVNRIKRYVKEHNIKENVHKPPIVGKFVDMTCPFRDDVRKICRIYEVRPMICKDFRCEKAANDIQASKRLYYARRNPVDLRKEIFRNVNVSKSN